MYVCTRYLRHPSYFGWFWWSIGTQVLLCNPLCAVVYAGAAWHFFKVRIPYEEALLMNFFPGQYQQYMARSYIGIPFIKGLDNTVYARRVDVSGDDSDDDGQQQAGSGDSDGDDDGDVAAAAGSDSGSGGPRLKEKGM